MLKSNTNVHAVSDPDSLCDQPNCAIKIDEQVDHVVLKAEELRGFLHDLDGPLASARGFTEELVCVRDCVKNLLENSEINISDRHKELLQYQIDDEMVFCLERVRRSLEKLGKTIESMREDVHLAN